jgi:hypothetical protein
MLVLIPNSRRSLPIRGFRFGLALMPALSATRRLWSPAPSIIMRRKFASSGIESSNPRRKSLSISRSRFEQTLLDLRRRFYVREVRYDPYQLVAVAQRLTAAGLPMVEFPQSAPNLTESSTNLYEAVKGRNLVVYPDDDVRSRYRAASPSKLAPAGASLRKRLRTRSMWWSR